MITVSRGLIVIHRNPHSSNCVARHIPCDPFGGVVSLVSYTVAVTDAVILERLDTIANHIVQLLSIGIDPFIIDLMPQNIKIAILLQRFQEGLGNISRQIAPYTHD